MKNFDIFGIGVDIVENKRIEQILTKYGLKFLLKIFSESEIKLAESKFECNLISNPEPTITNLKNISNFFAKRFAAKEAFLKALKIGFNSKIFMNDISILNDHLGCPIVEIEKIEKLDSIKKIISEKIQKEIFDCKFLISLSDEKCYSVAYAQIIVYFL